MTSGPLPLSLPSPSVCLLPSFIPSMVDLSAWQAGRPAVLTLVPLTRSLWPSAVSTRLKTPPPVPLLFRRPRGSGNYSCVSLCASGSGQSSQGNSQTHTHNLVPTGRKSYWICRCSGGQRESLRKFDKSFLHILSYTLHNFGIFNLGDFCPTLFQPFFSFGHVSQNRLSVLLVLRLFVFV